MERLSDYEYELPEAAIAQRPLDDRSSSRLLWLHKDSGAVEHKSFLDVVDILSPGDLLVLNNTRVTAFRLRGNKPTGAQVELLAIKQVGPKAYEALLKPGRRLQPGTVIHFGPSLRATIQENLSEGRKLVRFSGDLSPKIATAEAVPLPPYVHEQLQDPERYQTVYAEKPGSAAAPTAGLHFTPELLERLKAKGIATAHVTLDVGIDTFRPVQTEDPSRHPIHGEVCEVPPETAQAIQECRGRIIAVGTTTVRTLETFATGPRKILSGRRESRLFIRPGYPFKIVDGMFTNFHMPKTTMLMMISAFAGREAVMNGYDQALRTGYRFLSFGDSMLIL
ncbi:MAG: S-adenosylmethionine:tRNA ribosyltransferase-isomerase [Fimbriimonadaceae bacterium]|jgi:S-adenosylmethionine:tRNA ribosyltransferase-isomerase|nr:S-adenosylmethionine:tRNA ribosyltransferase-isomerase [Fimbriimonadaceae bacterium]